MYGVRKNCAGRPLHSHPVLRFFEESEAESVLKELIRRMILQDPYSMTFLISTQKPEWRETVIEHVVGKYPDMALSEVKG